MSELLLAKLLDWLLSRCTHPDYILRADILEGDCEGEAVQWCLYCGAYKRLNGWEFRRPQPTWALDTSNAIQAD